MVVIILIFILVTARMVMLCRAVSCSKSKEERMLEDEEQAAYLMSREAEKRVKIEVRRICAHEIY